MEDWNLSQCVFAAAVGTFSFVAAGFDLRTRKIPNALTLPMFALGWVYQIAFFGGAGAMNALAAFGAGFGLLFLLWLMGSGGGGDVKLVGALSVWLGLRLTILVLVVSTVFVLAGTLLILAAGLIRKGPSQTKDEYVADSDADATAEASSDRRVMAFAAPVALATWLLVIFELPLL